MEHHKLDSIDMRILSELQSNGRITNVELSRRAKITAPPCLRRMRALEKAGYVRGYHADLDGKLLGFEVSGFVFVGLASQAESDLKQFEEQVRVVADRSRVPHALRRSRFPAQGRRERSLRVPDLHHRHVDGGEERGERQEFTRDPSDERTNRACRSSSTRLCSIP